MMFAAAGRRKRLATTIRGSTVAGMKECWGFTSFTNTLADPVLIPSSKTLLPTQMLHPTVLYLNSTISGLMLIRVVGEG